MPLNMTASLEVYSHEEVHFGGEDQEVHILPSFALPKVHLLGGTYGPFRPQIQVSVPLWLASILKKQGRCIIVAPKWLSISSLRTVLESERTDDVFQALPFHYVEVATDLCKYAREDMEDWSLIYDLTENVRAVRHSKMQSGLRGLLDVHALKGVKLSNLASLEVNIIRRYMASSLDHLFISRPTK